MLLTASDRDVVFDGTITSSARPQAHGQQSKVERVEAVGDAHSGICPAMARELRLQGRLRSRRPAGVDRPRDCIVDRPAELVWPP